MTYCYHGPNYTLKVYIGMNKCAWHYTSVVSTPVHGLASNSIAIIITFSQKLFVRITEDGVYNAVWDDKVLLCYSLLQCKCDKLVGVLVHSSITGDGFESLNKKVSVASLKYIL